MKIQLTDTTASEIGAKLVELREEGGAVALGRVLTLIVATDEAGLEEAVEATNHASREHPCRVLMVVPGAGDDGLDAEIRVGGDAGASEIVVLRPRGETAGFLGSLVTPLLLPDAPIVTWWPGAHPDNPAADPLGAISKRRITDALSCADPIGSIRTLAEHHAPGDTDLAWARATLWRGLIAAALDEPPYTPVHRVTITGNLDHPSIVLIAAWLTHSLHCPVDLEPVAGAEAIVSVTLHRGNGDVVMERPVNTTVLQITEPSGIHHKVTLPLRTVADSLIEDLRRLDPDEMYGDVLKAARTHTLAGKR